MKRLALLAAVTAAAVPSSAAATDWTTFGFSTTRQAFNPAETALGTASFAGVKHLWAYDTGGVINAQPVYLADVTVDGTTRDLVFVGSESGHVAALDAATGLPLWTRQLRTVDTICQDVPEGLHGVSSTPVVDRDRGTLWVADGDSRVWALDIATGKTRLGWPVAIGHRNRTEHIWGALTLSRGRLYAATSSHCNNVRYRPHLTALHPETGKRRAVWRPTKGSYGGGIWGWGGLGIDPASGDIYAATANGQWPKPETYPYAEHVVRLSKRLELLQSDLPPLPKRDDNDFSGAPLLFQAPGCPKQLVVGHKSGRLFLYDRRRIARGPVQWVQAGSVEAFVGLGTYAYSPATRMVYLSNGSAGDYVQGLVALHVTEACRLGLAWQHAIGDYPTWPTVPVIANGVVVFGDGSNKRLHAFDALDGTPLWNSGGVTGDLYGPPVIVEGRIFAPSWDQKVHAFGL